MKTAILALAILALTACSRPAEGPAPAADTATVPPAVSPADVEPAPGPFARVSFDCAKATDMTEKMVCADPELAQLDGRLVADVANARAKASDPDRQTLAATQDGWAKGRNDCWKAVDKRRCVLESYETRLVELAINSGEFDIPAPVEYACGDNSQPFAATFYNNLDPRSAVLTYGTDSQAIVFAEPSGSGTKYGRDGVQFREHQGEATVNWYGTEFKCTVPKAGIAHPL